MFAKPFTFLLVFLLAVTNFIVLLIPISILFFPLFMIFQTLFVKIGANLFFFIIAKVSLLIIAYVVFDSIFGITMRRLRKGCIPFKKANSVYGHNDIIESFELLKKKFKINNVKLYIDPNFKVINAYAVGSFSGSIVTVTLGLLNQMKEKANSYDEYLDSVRGILGHEMSHLANKDFLPGLLTSASESASNFLSKVIKWIFVALAAIFKIIPWVGWPISQLIIMIYNIVNFSIMAFFNYIFMPVYNFILKFFGRAIEYRCDKESAYAFGGHNMAKALSFLGGRGYFSLFSTHPTTNSRIKKVQNIKIKEGTIRPGIINMLCNFSSMVLVVYICLYSTSISNTAEIYQHYINEVYIPVTQQLNQYQRDVMQVYYKFTGRY